MNLLGTINDSESAGNLGNDLLINATHISHSASEFQRP